MATAEAFITPEVLRWARERDRLSTEITAKKLNVKPARVEEWEAGVARPTFRQAEHLAQQLNVPFGYLFLSTPPVETLPLPDLRTVADQPASTASPELWDVLSDALEKQDWYREYQETEGGELLKFIASRSINDKPDLIAADICEALGVNADLRARARSWEDFLRLFIAQAENAGILVLRSGIVGSNTHRSLKVEEFRGFAISDDRAPLVFINAKDAKAAQIFTLAHELVHLWLGESGISNPNYREPAERQVNSVERLCNRVAADVLLPREAFLAAWKKSVAAKANIQAISAAFRVSRMVALRQALDLELLTSDRYWELYQELVGESGPIKAESGGNFYATLLARNSPTLTTALLSSLAEGRVSYMDASRLLNVRASGLDNIKQRVLGHGGDLAP